MTKEYVGSQDANSFWSWPVRWAPAVRRAATRGQHPDVVLDDPQLVAHRILDRLAALAFDVYQGAPDASRAFVDAIQKLIGAAPWVVSDSRRRNVNSTADSKNAHLGASTQEDVQAPLEDALIDSRGVIALLAVAARLAGKDGARAILEVSAAAIAAEQWLPGLSHTSEAGYRADIAALGDAFITDAQQWSEGERASQIAPSSIGAPVWEKLSTLAHTNGAAANKIRCLKLFHELTDNAVPPPEPEGPVSWTTGIDHVEVTDPCGASPLLTIHGQGFGSAMPGVGVVAAMWDEETSAIVYRTVPVVSWSDTQVVVQLGPNTVGGVVAFADIAFINIYNLWADSENERVATAMHAAGCPGYGPPASPVIWSHWSETPAPVPAATYEAGMPRIVAEITLEPVGKAPALWSSDSVHLQTGEAFWVLWKTANADTAALRASGAAGSQLLVAAGHPASGVVQASGSVRLVAPSRPAVVEFRVEASNACGTVHAPLRTVVTGPALQPATITVLQSLPGGDVDVLVSANGVESLTPATGRSIPLVAQKRTVARIDWWTAVPQVPPGEELTAQASIEVTGPAATWPSTVTLRPGASTANEPPSASDPPVELRSGRPFSSVLEYEQWIAQSPNNNPATFNVMLPAELCVGEVTLKATVRARNRDGRLWAVAATRSVKFHQRRRVVFRYRPWQKTKNLNGAPPILPPTNQECEAVLRAAASLLPISDPQIFRLPGPWDPNGNEVAAEAILLLEGLVAERGGTWGGPSSLAWRDEIWFSIGGGGGEGGFAPGDPSGLTYWVASTGVREVTAAHEMGHMFGEIHLNLCMATDGENPVALTDNGMVIGPGWDMWNNRPVRNVPDLMADVCRLNGAVWMNPERWRRIFLRLRP